MRILAITDQGSEQASSQAIPNQGCRPRLAQRPERGSELGTEEFGFCPCREGPYRSSACPLSVHWGLLMPARGTQHGLAEMGTPIPAVVPTEPLSWAFLVVP